MKKNKSFSFSILSLLILFFVFTSIFGLPFLNKSNSTTSFALTSQTNENFYIDVIGRNGNTLTAQSTTYNGGTAFVFQWEETSKFIFNINASASIPPAVYENSQPVYKLTISIEYLKGYKNNSTFYQANTIYKESEYSKTVRGEGSYSQFVNYSPEFDIDAGTSGQYLDNTSAQINEWGIYRFKLLINSQQTYSDYFIIEPTREILENGKAVSPIIKSTPRPPTEESFHATYFLELTNNETFKYIDTQKLIWYVYGVAEDGRTYIFSYQDVNKEEFADKFTNTLWSENEGVPVRTGRTFYFDDRGISGTWQVWCEYQYEGAYDDQIVKSNVIELKTGNSIHNLTVLWIALSIAVVSFGVTLGICIYKVKREKVY